MKRFISMFVKSIGTLLHTVAMVIFPVNTLWLFAVGICRSFLLWEFAAAICRENLPQLFVVSISRGFVLCM